MRFIKNKIKKAYLLSEGSSGVKTYKYKKTNPKSPFAINIKTKLINKNTPSKLINICSIVKK